MSDDHSKIRFLAEGNSHPKPKPKKKSSLKKNLSTPENRAFWAAAEEASERIKSWPKWKQEWAASWAADRPRQSEIREDD